MLMLCLVSMFALAAGVAQNEIPEYLLQCHKNDPNRDDCLMKLLNHLRPYVKTGIPDIGIHAVEPFFLDAITIKQGSNAVNVEVSLTNQTVNGISGYRIMSVTSDVSNPKLYKFNVTADVPMLFSRGHYSVNGRVLVVPIRGNGNAQAMIYDALVRAYAEGHPITKDGQRRFELTRIFTDFGLKDIHFKLDNLFDGDSVLGDTVNKFLNENAHELIPEIKPALAKEISRIVKMFLNTGLREVPLEWWLKDD